MFLPVRSGEYVVNENATRMFLPFLEELNKRYGAGSTAGSGPGLSSGGFADQFRQRYMASAQGFGGLHPGALESILNWVSMGAAGYVNLQQVITRHAGSPFYQTMAQEAATYLRTTLSHEDIEEAKGALYSGMLAGFPKISAMASARHHALHNKSQPYISQEPGYQIVQGQGGLRSTAPYVEPEEWMHKDPTYTGPERLPKEPKYIKWQEVMDDQTGLTQYYGVTSTGRRDLLKEYMQSIYGPENKPPDWDYRRRQRGNSYNYGAGGYWDWQYGSSPPAYASGGTVAIPRGQSALAMLHGGERVYQPGFEPQDRNMSRIIALMEKILDALGNRSTAPQMASRPTQTTGSSITTAAVVSGVMREMGTQGYDFPWLKEEVQRLKKDASKFASTGGSAAI
jgi:hypothetical protein